MHCILTRDNDSVQWHKRGYRQTTKEQFEVNSKDMMMDKLVDMNGIWFLLKKTEISWTDTIKPTVHNTYSVACYSPYRHCTLHSGGLTQPTGECCPRRVIYHMPQWHMACSLPCGTTTSVWCLLGDPAGQMHYASLSARSLPQRVIHFYRASA